MATLAGAQTSTYAGATVWRVILEWLTTVDHKKIGIMYLWTAGAFGLVGMAFSLVMRTELAETGTIISAETYNSIFTMHGSVMIFLFLLPIGAAFMNYSMPLQIGALDMAFPRINALSFWIFLFGGVLLTLSFAAEGGTASAGWTAYPPVTLDTGNNAEPPGAGMDMWLVGVILLGQASIFGSVNFLVTIFKMRAPGMTMWRLPLFTWTTLVTGLLILLSTPVLAAALVLGFIDRNGAGGAFFDPAGGRSAAALAESVLVLFASRRVHHDLAGDGHRLRCVRRFHSTPRVRLSLDGLGADCNRSVGLHRVGASHVHDRRRLPAVLHGRNVPDRGANRGQDVQLDHDDVAWLEHLPDGDAVQRGLPDAFPDRRDHRRVPRRRAG